MNGRHLLYRAAALLYPGRRAARRRVRREAAPAPAPAAGLAGLDYDALLARVRQDLALEARLGHVEDLIAHLDQRFDRVLRELARRDPATRWEDPPGADAERAGAGRSAKP